MRKGELLAELLFYCQQLGKKRRVLAPYTKILLQGTV